jgi:hypothetical protein
MIARIPAMLTVYDGRTCIGWIFERGKLGHEAFTADQRSLGTYSSQREAADAVSAAGQVRQ